MVQHASSLASLGCLCSRSLLSRSPLLWRPPQVNVFCQVARECFSAVAKARDDLVLRLGAWMLPSPVGPALSACAGASRRRDNSSLRHRRRKKPAWRTSPKNAVKEPTPCADAPSPQKAPCRMTMPHGAGMARLGTVRRRGQRLAAWSVVRRHRSAWLWWQRWPKASMVFGCLSLMLNWLQAAVRSWRGLAAASARNDNVVAQDLYQSFSARECEVSRLFCSALFCCGLWLTHSVAVAYSCV